VDSFGDKKIIEIDYLSEKRRKHKHSHLGLT